MSLDGSTNTGTAFSAPVSVITWVSCSPEITCALVTTRPGRATHPVPCSVRPQDDPSTITTLRSARRTAGETGTDRSGGGRLATPPTPSTGRRSNRAIASISDCAGTQRTSRGRIVEDCTSWRSPRLGWLIAVTATSQATASPSAVPATRPPAPSMVASGPISTLRRTAFASGLVAACAIAPPITAPSSAATGSHSARALSDSAYGASRDPTQAPAAKPASASTWAANPRRRPTSADSVSHTITIRSAPVTLGSIGAGTVVRHS